MSDFVTMAFDFEHDPKIRTHHYRVFDEVTDMPGSVYSTTPGYWMFTKMETIHDALSRTDLFSNSPLSAMKTAREQRVPYKFVPQQLDPPIHGKYRKVLNPLLSPVQMRMLEPRIREVAARIITELRPAGRCEVVADFARPVVTEVFLDLFGLPPADSLEFAGLAARLLVGDPEDVDGASVRAVFDQLTAFLAGHIEERRVHPTDDLLSGMVHGTIDGEPILQSRLAEMAIQVFTAGLETTTAAIGYFIRHCAGDQTTQAAIRADRGLVPAAVEESLRLYTQVAPSRRVTEDADFHGCPVKAGDYVVLPLTCANRDERAFTTPRDFDLFRAKNRHIAFGIGPHRCVGSHLARVELYGALDVWHQLIPSYRHAADANFEDYVVGIAGPVRVDIQWS